MKNTSKLAGALNGAGARTAAPAVEHPDPPGLPGQDHPKTVSASRVGTVAITVHHPEIVRRTLKALAGEEGRHVDDMVAEALNLLFAKFRKPEVAPRKSSK